MLRLSSKGRLWLAEELKPGQPKMGISLGSEVAGILLGCGGAKAKEELTWWGHQAVTYWGCLLSGYSLCPSWGRDAPPRDRNIWPRLHLAHVAEARMALHRILEAK